MKEKGFTLAELMVVVAIFTVISGAVFATFGIGRVAWQSANAQIDVVQEARRAADRIAWDLRQTKTNQISGVPADGNWYSSITFRIPSAITANGTVVWSSNVTYSVGGLNNAQLLRSAAVVANNITQARFRRNAATPNVIDIDVQSRKITQRGYTVTAQAAMQVRLRN